MLRLDVLTHPCALGEPLVQEWQEGQVVERVHQTMIRQEQELLHQRDLILLAQELQTTVVQQQVHCYQTVHQPPALERSQRDLQTLVSQTSFLLLEDEPEIRTNLVELALEHQRMEEPVEMSMNQRLVLMLLLLHCFQC